MLFPAFSGYGGMREILGGGPWDPTSPTVASYTGHPDQWGNKDPHATAPGYSRDPGSDFSPSLAGNSVNIQYRYRQNPRAMLDLVGWVPGLSGPILSPPNPGQIDHSQLF